MYFCKGCLEYFEEPDIISPERNPHLSIEDYDLWGDHENEDCCPYCGCLDIVRIREDEDE